MVFYFIFNNCLMYIMIQYLLSCTIIIILFIYLYTTSNQLEKFSNKPKQIWMWYSEKQKYPSGGLGNILSVFYNSMIYNYKNNLDHNYELNKTFDNRTHYINLYNSFNECTFTMDQLNLFPNRVKYDDIWNIKKHSTQKYWYNIKLEVNNSLKAFTKDIKENKLHDYPILHFRCSDVPFVKHKDYCFVKYIFYKLCHDKLKHKYDKWYIMWDNSHLSNTNNTKLSTLYFKDLKNYLEKELHLEIIHIKKNNQYEDFKLLYNNPVVIQGGCGGSFSFFGGYFNGLFLHPNSKQYSDMELIVTHDKIDEVGGYANITNTIKLLRS